MNKKTNYNLYTNILTFLFSLAIFILFWWIFEANTLFAADKLTYTLLADLPGVGDSPTHSEYLSNAIKLIIGLITALSVLVMVYAGVEHVAGAANESSRSAAKEKMWGALVGLIIALVSYIVLSTINPDLLSLDLTLDDVPAATVPGTSCVCPCPDPCISNPTLPGCPDPCAGFCASTGACP